MDKKNLIINHRVDLEYKKINQSRINFQTFSTPYFSRFDVNLKYKEMTSNLFEQFKHKQKQVLSAFQKVIENQKDVISEFQLKDRPQKQMQYISYSSIIQKSEIGNYFPKPQEYINHAYVLHGIAQPSLSFNDIFDILFLQEQVHNTLSYDEKVLIRFQQKKNSWEFIKFMKKGYKIVQSQIKKNQKDIKLKDQIIFKQCFNIIKFKQNTQYKAICKNIQELYNIIKQDDQELKQFSQLQKFNYKAYIKHVFIKESNISQTQIQNMANHLQKYFTDLIDSYEFKTNQNRNNILKKLTQVKLFGQIQLVEDKYLPNKMLFLMKQNDMPTQQSTLKNILQYQIFNQTHPNELSGIFSTYIGNDQLVFYIDSLLQYLFQCSLQINKVQIDFHPNALIFNENKLLFQPNFDYYLTNQLGFATMPLSYEQKIIFYTLDLEIDIYSLVKKVYKDFEMYEKQDKLCQYITILNNKCWSQKYTKIQPQSTQTQSLSSYEKISLLQIAMIFVQIEAMKKILPNYQALKDTDYEKAYLFVFQLLIENKIINQIKIESSNNEENTQQKQRAQRQSQTPRNQPTSNISINLAVEKKYESLKQKYLKYFINQKMQSSQSISMRNEETEISNKLSHLKHKEEFIYYKLLEVQLKQHQDDWILNITLSIKLGVYSFIIELICYAQSHFNRSEDFKQIIINKINQTIQQSKTFIGKFKVFQQKLVGKNHEQKQGIRKNRKQKRKINTFLMGKINSLSQIKSAQYFNTIKQVIIEKKAQELKSPSEQNKFKIDSLQIKRQQFQSARKSQQKLKRISNKIDQQCFKIRMQIFYDLLQQLQKQKFSFYQRLKIEAYLCLLQLFFHPCCFNEIKQVISIENRLKINKSLNQIDTTPILMRRVYKMKSMILDLTSKYYILDKNK